MDSPIFGTVWPFWCWCAVKHWYNQSINLPFLKSKAGIGCSWSFHNGCWFGTGLGCRIHHFLTIANVGSCPEFMKTNTYGSFGKRRLFPISRPLVAFCAEENWTKHSKYKDIYPRHLSAIHFHIYLCCMHVANAFWCTVGPKSFIFSHDVLRLTVVIKWSLKPHKVISSCSFRNNFISWGIDTPPMTWCWAPVLCTMGSRTDKCWKADPAVLGWL